MVSKNVMFVQDIQAISGHKKQNTPIIVENPSSNGTCSIVENLKSYCSSTALHGCSYIIKKDVRTSARIGWFVLVFVAILVSITMLWVSYNLTSKTLTVTVIESTHFSTLNVPFPAVTICGINRISKRKAYAVAEKLTKPDNVTVDELARLLILPLDFSGILSTEESEYLKLGEILDANNITPIVLMHMLVPSCNDMLTSCSWKGSKVNCPSLFQNVNTTEGVCCSFNYHGLMKNNFPERFAYAVSKKPYRISSSGYQTGLSVVLDPDVHDYFGTYLSSYGFRILMHNSYDYPDANAETKVLPLNTENFIGILPQSAYSTQAVISLKPEARDCLVHNERKMRVFQRYSYINCLAECRALFAYNLCGCMPMRFVNNGSYPPCRMEQVFCIKDNIITITGAIPGLNETILRNFEFQGRPCGCLPDCELNLYPAEIASADLSRPDPTNKYDRWGGVIKNKVIAHIYFSDLVSTRYRKDIFQNWLGQLASFGGLLGLIMGFSLVTAFEFIYYLTIRPLFDKLLV